MKTAYGFKNNDPRKVTAMCNGCRRDSEIYCFIFISFQNIIIKIHSIFLYLPSGHKNPHPIVCDILKFVCVCVCVKSQTLSFKPM